MALITAEILQDADWSIADDLILMLGTEGAASLAASTPAGGTEKKRVKAWQDGSIRGGLGLDALGSNPLGSTSIGYGLGEGPLGGGLLGINNWPKRKLQYNYLPTDKCASLPVGVKASDAAGNLSAVAETLVDINDPPRGARALSFQSSGSPNEVQLDWTVSPDV